MKNKTIFYWIYKLKLWGRHKGFYSGDGSSIGVSIYSSYILRMIESMPKPVTILDLGCGDFRVGRTLINENVSYIGIDVVQNLIEHNRIKYQVRNISFYQADIVNDNLPDADIVLIRQVLQHLDNESIKKILNKIKKYKICLITEHQTNGEPNQDKSTGFGIRKGGIHLDKEPFNIGEVVLTLPHNDWGILSTYLISQKHV